MKKIIILSLVLGAFIVPTTTHGAFKLFVPYASDSYKESIIKEAEKQEEAKQKREAEQAKKAQELKAQERENKKVNVTETVVISEVINPTVKSTTTSAQSIEADDSEVIAQLWEQIRILQAQIILLLAGQQI